jgi:hypothetical protein
MPNELAGWLGLVALVALAWAFRAGMLAWWWRRTAELFGRPSWALRAGRHERAPGKGWSQYAHLHPHAPERPAFHRSGRRH